MKNAPTIWKAKPSPSIISVICPALTLPSPARLISGMQDSVDAINEQGGVRGAQIEVQFQDTGGSVDEAVAAYDRFTSEDDNVLVMITYGSGEVEALGQPFC